jgi:hypothetical protein
MMNVATILVLLWAFAYPYPYEVAIWILIFMPIIALLTLHLFHGVMRFDTSRRSPHPGMAYVFIAPSLGLAFRALKDWGVLGWTNFWLPFVVVAIGVLSLTFRLATDIRGKVASMILTGVFCCVYGFGATISLNGMLDSSSPTICHGIGDTVDVISGSGWLEVPWFKVR